MSEQEANVEQKQEVHTHNINKFFSNMNLNLFRE